MRGKSASSVTAAGVVLRAEGAKTIVELHGDWTVETVGRMDATLRDVEDSVPPSDIVIDLADLGMIDTAGAYIIGRST